MWKYCEIEMKLFFLDFSRQFQTRQQQKYSF